MSTALVVSESNTTALTQLLVEIGVAEVPPANSAEQALTAMKKFQTDLVIINAPIMGGNDNRLALSVAEARSSSVILLTPDVETVNVREFLSKGILVIKKPAAKANLDASIRYVLAVRGSQSSVTDENRKLKEELAETKVVNRAKLLLIQYLGMTETQAHKTIERRSMDGRLKRIDVAREIIKIYAS